MRNIFQLLTIWMLFSSCATTHNGVSRDVPVHSLRFIGQYEVPFNEQFQGTTIGGLSGIDYDPGKKIYYLISDDPSDINPARFYTARIYITAKGIDSVRFESVVTLLNSTGNAFSALKKNREETTDPEAIRYFPKTGNLFWTSEGERHIKADTVLHDPSITIMNKRGGFVSSFPLPRQVKMYPHNLGTRQNGTFEGLTFADNFRSMYVSIEEPLYEDGPRAGLEDADAWTRILKYSVRSKKPVAQYSYRLAPIAHPPNPANGFFINGITDILSTGDNMLLVIERSFSTGIKSSAIKIFAADLQNATDVSNITSLTEQAVRNPVVKKTFI